MNLIINLLIWISYFIGLYTLVFWFVTYLENHNRIKKEIKTNYRIKEYPLVSIAIPAFNEEKSIHKTILSIIGLDYPKEKLEIFVINDGSNDNTSGKAEEIIRRYPNYKIILINQKNQGKARSLNNVIKKINGDYFVCLDADSTVDPKALKYMISRFQNDPELAILTPVLKIEEPKTIIQKFQRVEYLAAMLVIKLMSYLNMNYVAPGPFSVYKTSVLKKLGKFDTKSIVEDQEMACRAQKYHFKIGQCTKAVVKTIAPYNLKGLHKQRNRWFKGTLMNVYKYKKLVFNKKYGDFGYFQLPLVLFAYFLGITAIIAFAYYAIRPAISYIQHLFLINFDILPYFKDIKFSFNILNLDIPTFFIIYLMLAITIVLLFLSSRMTKDKVRLYGTIYLIPYFFVYFLILSVILVRVLFEMAVGKKQKW